MNPGRSYADALPEVTVALMGAKAGDEITLQMNAVYGEALEYGHSGQAPEGFVRLTLMHAQDLVNDVANAMGSEGRV